MQLFSGVNGDCRRHSDASLRPGTGARLPALSKSVDYNELRLKICNEDWGTGSMHGLSTLLVNHFPSLSANIDYARKECAAAHATIELFIDG